MFARLTILVLPFPYRTPLLKTRSFNSLARVTWDAARAPKLLIADENYEEVITSEEPIKNVLQSLLQYGLALVHQVPATTEATRSVLERFGPAWPTFWGEEFHVVADLTQHAHPSYTSGDLGLHTDTNYYHEGAGLQAFHVLEHTGAGGINSFVDGFHVAHVLKSNEPAAYEALSTIPVPFKYRQNGTSYSNTDFILRHHPTTDQLLQVRFTPYDFDIFHTIRPTNSTVFYEALTHMRRLIDLPDHAHLVKLKPGTTVITDNWRILHGRSSFSGRRVLCGLYVSRSDFIGRAKAMGLC